MEGSYEVSSYVMKTAERMTELSEITDADWLGFD